MMVFYFPFVLGSYGGVVYVCGRGIVALTFLNGGGLVPGYRCVVRVCIYGS